MQKVLFICTGNTCRSPMAEAIFNKAVKDDKSLRENWTGESAGVFADEGDPASTHAVTVLAQDYGIDLHAHRARMLNEEILNSADLILTMTESQKYTVLSLFPRIAPKLHTLKEFAVATSYGDISDPFGQSLLVYRQSAKEIHDLVMKVIEILDRQK